jgi:hypothetical protein
MKRRAGLYSGGLSAFSQRSLSDSAGLQPYLVNVLAVATSECSQIGVSASGLDAEKRLLQRFSALPLFPAIARIPHLVPMGSRPHHEPSA